MANVTDEEYDREVAASRHKELQKALQSVLAVINKQPNGDVLQAVRKEVGDVKTAIDGVAPQAATLVARQLASLPDSDSPEVVAALTHLEATIVAALGNLRAALPSAEKKVWEFKINRNAGGFIESVTAIQMT